MPCADGIPALLLLLLVLGFAIVFLSPQVAEQAQMLREEIPKAWSKTQERLANTSWGQWMLEIGNGPSDWLPQPKTLTSGFAGVFTTTVGAISGALAAMFIGLFLAVEPGTYVRGVVALFPLRRRARIREVITLLGRVLRRWLLAKFISMAVVGLLTGIGLWLLEVPLAISLAVLASLLTFIPNIGPVIAAVPALLLGFVDGPSKALSVALLYLAVQTVESYGITPFVERETVALRPALTLSAQLALGLLAGFVGVIVATPLTAVCIVIVQTLYIQDVLGDRAQTSLADEK